MVEDGAGLIAPLAALVLAQAPAAGVVLEIGHAYSSAEALRQPATFSLIKEHARPWLTALDVGALVSAQGGWSWLELGARASTGSSRPRSRRVYGALLRASVHGDPVVFSVAAEYEADGGFEVEKGVLGAELTPAAVPSLAIGIPRGGFRWRPWLGAGYGNVFSTSAAQQDIEAKNFFRAYARIEATWEPGAVSLGLEGTSWLVDGAVPGTNFGKGALSVPLGSGGFSVSLTGEIGRRPPRFEYVGRLAIGLGFTRRGS